jgi:hypothetical protein
LYRFAKICAQVYLVKINEINSTTEHCISPKGLIVAGLDREFPAPRQNARDCHVNTLKIQGNSASNEDGEGIFFSLLFYWRPRLRSELCVLERNDVVAGGSQDHIGATAVCIRFSSRREKIAFAFSHRTPCQRGKPSSFDQASKLKTQLIGICNWDFKYFHPGTKSECR